MAAIKVLYLIDHLGYGGAQWSVRGIVEHLGGDFEPVVCSLGRKSEELSMGAAVVHADLSRYSLASFGRVLRLCERVRPDIVHCQLAKSNIVGMLLGHRLGRVVIAHERGNFSMAAVSRCVYRGLFWLLAGRADVLLANSGYTAQMIGRGVGGGADLRVLYNAIDFSALAEGGADRAQARARLGVSDDVFVVGYVGRLHRLKGVDILIRAMERLGRRGRFLLYVVGDGPFRAQLQALARSLGVGERVVFAGHFDQIGRVVPAFDVSVVPSRQEAFGRVAVELMYLRVPVVVSGVGGLGELVSDGVNGLVAGQDARAYARAIMRLYEDRQLRANLAEAGYEFSLDFGIEKHVERLERLYSELAEKAGL